MKVNFGPSRNLEIAYERALRKLIGETLPAKRPDQSFEDWISRIAALGNSSSFTPSAHNLARSIVQTSIRLNTQAWKNAAAAQAHSRMIYRLLQQDLNGPIGTQYDAIIRRNAGLIRSVPAEVAQHLSAHLAKAQQAGIRHEVIAKMLRAELPRLADWKIKLIARTEVAKAATALTEVRARNIGIGWAQWKTSKDARVRRSHRLMEGVLISWDDPPSPEALAGEHSSLGHYLPGGCPNCRCNPFPLMSLDDVTWPAKVHMQGRIVHMPRAQFAQMAGVESALPANSPAVSAPISNSSPRFQ
jgi:SPP1 gp7 family putative phage head morphogenesis protein